MKFPTPPPLKQKPQRPNPWAPDAVDDRAAAKYVLAVSAMGFALVSLAIGGTLCFFLWGWLVSTGYPLPLASFLLTLFFFAGLLLGSWSGRLVVYELYVNPNKNKKHD